MNNETVTEVSPLRRGVIEMVMKALTNPLVIEVGTARNEKGWAERTDGWSTKWWASFPCTLHSIDVSQDAIAASKKIVPAGHHERVTWYVGDAIDILPMLPDSPDVLFLDGGDDPLAAFLQFTICYKAGVVLIDDTHQYGDFKEGKGTELLAFFRERGTEILHFHSGAYRMSLALWKGGPCAASS